MSFFKDIYVEEYQKLLLDMLDQGAPAHEAENYASEAAYLRARDRVADLVDAARQRQKDERHD